MKLKASDKKKMKLNSLKQKIIRTVQKWSVRKFLFTLHQQPNFHPKMIKSDIKC